MNTAFLIFLTVRVLISGAPDDELLKALNEQGKPLTLTFVSINEGEPYDFRLVIEDKNVKKDLFGFQVGRFNIVIQSPPPENKVIGIVSHNAGYGARKPPYKAEASDLVKRIDRFLKESKQ